MRPIIFIFFTVFAFSFFQTHNARGSHAAGADITWKCLGGDSFMVLVTIYRDCNGCNIIELGGPCAYTLLRVKPSCGTSRVYYLNVMSVTDVTKVCSKSCSRCDTSTCGFAYGIQKIVLGKVINLSTDTCCDFTLSVNISARTSAITTGGSNRPLFITSLLNKCVIPCNNSPFFQTPPTQIFCVGQCVQENLEALDEDGDSLVYSLTNPLQGLGNFVPWLGNYSYNKPLYFTGFPNQNLSFSPPLCRGFHFDSTTGLLQFKPTLSQITLVAYKVEEYRNGVKISEVMRDVQLTVMSCTPNAPPVMTGIDSTQSFKTTACAGGTLCFKLYASDSNATDTFIWSVDTLFPGAILTPDLPTGSIMTFCWTPQLSDTGKTHYVNISVSDDKCPLPSFSTKKFEIEVIADSIVKVNVDSNFTTCYEWKSIPLSASPTGGSWSGPGVSSSYFNPALAGVGIHSLFYRVSGGNCFFSNVVRATVPPNPEAAFTTSATLGVNPLSTNFLDTTSGSIASWQWDFGDNSSSNIQNPSHNYTMSDSFDVQLVVTDTLGCRDTLLKKDYVIVLDSISTVSDFAVCIDAAPIVLSGFPYGGTWAGPGMTDSTFTPSIANAGIHWLVYAILINGVLYTDSVQATVRPLPYLNLSGSPRNGALALEVAFTGISSSNIVQWNWDFGDLDSSFLRNPTHLYTAPGEYKVSLTATDAMGCIRSISANRYIRIPTPLKPVATFHFVRKPPKS